LFLFIFSTLPKKILPPNSGQVGHKHGPIKNVAPDVQFMVNLTMLPTTEFIFRYGMMYRFKEILKIGFIIVRIVQPNGSVPRRLSSIVVTLMTHYHSCAVIVPRGSKRIIVSSSIRIGFMRLKNRSKKLVTSVERCT
jgi:hypothetical protein